MAKRSKEDAEETQDYEFVPPDFDEDAFIHKEMVSFRTTSTLIAVGVLAAIISALLYGRAGGPSLSWFIGLAIFGVAFAALKPLFGALKFDIAHYGRREWLGNGFLLFFTWLAFFMIALNPPISDHAPPHLAIYASPSVAQAGDPITFDVFYADNDKISEHTFELTGQDGSIVATTADLQRIASGHYRYTALLPIGSHMLVASATDPAGHASSANMTVGVVADLVDLHIADLTDPTEELFVQLPTRLADNVYAVYADMDGNVDTMGDRVYFKHEEDRGGWEATANYKGWTAGTNNFTVIVEENNRFEAQTVVKGGILRDGPHTIEVTNPGDYSKSQPSKANPDTPPSRRVPGFELPLIGAGVLAAAFIARRRQ